MGLVVEDPPEVVPVGEHLRLQGQKRSAGIHHVNAGKVVVQGDFLGAQVLLDGNRVVGAALDGGVIGEKHDLFPLDHADAGHDTGGRFLPVVHVPCRQGTQLKEGSVGVDQPLDPLPGQQLAPAAVQLHRPLPAASPHTGQPIFQVPNQGLHAGLVVLKIPVGGSQVGADYFHAIPGAAFGRVAQPVRSTYYIRLQEPCQKPPDLLFRALASQGARVLWERRPGRDLVQD